MAGETISADRTQGVDKFLKGLEGDDIVLRMTWEDWMDITPSYPIQPFTKQRVKARYSRNGYDWDIHGTVYTPEKEIDPSIAVVVGHGTNGSECNMDLTPDGRPGMAQNLAMQGFKIMTLSYPGHFGPGPDGEWTAPIPERNLRYIDGPDRPLEEVEDRMLKCTFDTNIQGVATLVEEHFAGRRLIGTNGPMCGRLPLFLDKTELVGTVAYGHGGTDGWRMQWREDVGVDNAHGMPIDEVERKSVEYHKGAGYENDRDISPWGGAEEYIENVSLLRSQMKSSLCVNQHDAFVEVLEEYPKRSGLPRGEYFDYLDPPRPEDLKKQAVLLLVGEKDKKHWILGDRIEDKREVYMANKYAQHSPRVHLAVLPRYGHSGHCELHNEKAVYLWGWAHREGYFNL